MIDLTGVLRAHVARAERVIVADNKIGDDTLASVNIALRRNRARKSIVFATRASLVLSRRSCTKSKVIGILGVGKQNIRFAVLNNIKHRVLVASERNICRHCRKSGSSHVQQQQQRTSATAVTVVTPPATTTVAALNEFKGKLYGRCQADDCDCDEYNSRGDGRAACGACDHAALKHVRLGDAVPASTAQVRHSLHNHHRCRCRWHVRKSPKSMARRRHRRRIWCRRRHSERKLRAAVMNE